MYKNGFSIIICCYNSSERLPKTLGSLSSLIIPENWEGEIIVVDNNSNDDTAKIAEGLFATLPAIIPYKIVSEPLPGLSFARKRGADEAQYNYLVFCDDDNHFFKDYIKNLFEIVQDGTVAGVGGYGIPLYNAEPPGWFKRYEANFATGHQYPKEGFISFGATMYGAGLVIKHGVYDEIKKVSALFKVTDRKGAATSSGEDSLTLLIGHYLGYKFFYSEKMKFYHLIEERRISWEYLNKIFYSFGEAAALLSPINHEMRGVPFAKSFFILCKSVFFLFSSKTNLQNHTSLERNYNLGYRMAFVKGYPDYLRIRKSLKAVKAAVN